MENWYFKVEMKPHGFQQVFSQTQILGLFPKVSFKTEAFELPQHLGTKPECRR
jgi:hypothetical protein